MRIAVVIVLATTLRFRNETLGDVQRRGPSIVFPYLKGRRYTAF
jgi:hypothetical protein